MSLNSRPLPGLYGENLCRGRSRNKPFVHKALARQVIAPVGSREIQPHLPQFFIPVRLQRLARFIAFAGATLFLQQVLLARTASQPFCYLSDVVAEAGCILFKGLID